MPAGAKREAIDKLAKTIGDYLHLGRHVLPGDDALMAGEFPVDQRDAVFVHNLTKLLLADIASVTQAS